MVVKRRKKSTRQQGQGTGTHGWGKNKHRGSGSRGGFGRAGTGKKSHNKKTSVWKEEYFGKHGFVSRQRKEDSIITLRDVEDKIPSWLNEKQIREEAGIVVVDLSKLGYDKLLSTGKVTRKIKITIPKASASAGEKIKAAGGELVVGK